MRIPHHLFTARQATLPTEAVQIEPPVRPSSTDDSDSVNPMPTRTTTLPRPSPSRTSASPSSSGDSGSGTILAHAEASTNLSWWQMLCIGLGGALLIAVLAWAWWGARKKSANDKKRAKEIEAEEERRVKELMEARKKAVGQRGESETDSGSDESYDSVSDGGTIISRRRKQARLSSRRKHDGRRRDSGQRKRRLESETESESESDYTSESSYMSAETYYPRRRTRRRLGGRAYRHRDRHDGGLDRRPRRRRDVRKAETAPPDPYDRPMPRGQASHAASDTSFRDSVFSSYKSMKKAAVQLKYVEAKAKLKTQLEDEDRLERERQAKINEANREIELARQAESASSDRPLIRPARPQTQSSSGSSTGRLPTPPPRSARRGYSNGPTTSVHIPPVPVKQHSHRPTPSRQDTGLTAEIGNLLGNKPSRPRAPAPAAQSAALQSSWLPRPEPVALLPHAARSGSVYLSVTRPRDRPMIPPGGLAPPPPPKVRSGKHLTTAGHEGDSAHTDLGAGKGKWADRLRSRR